MIMILYKTYSYNIALYMHRQSYEIVLMEKYV